MVQWNDYHRKLAIFIEPESHMHHMLSPPLCKFCRAKRLYQYSVVKNIFTSGFSLICPEILKKIVISN